MFVNQAYKRDPFGSGGNLLFFTGAPLVVVMGILSLIGMFELYRVLKWKKHPVATASYVASVLYYVLVYF